MRVAMKWVKIAVLTISVGVAGLTGQETNPVTEETMTREIILVVTGGRVRTEPKTEAEIIRQYTIGTRFTAVSEQPGWDEVKLGLSEECVENTGWIAKRITEPYDASRPGIQFQRIANKYLSREKIGFSTAKELFEYLPNAADDAKTYEVGGDLRLKSLIAMGYALKAIPFGKSDTSPYKEFLEKYSEDVVFSEPAGEWYVKSQQYWELHQRYRKHKIAETIAWKAAGNPLPGECEGYINCYLYLLRATQGEYLNFYPSGKFSKQAIGNINGLLQPIVSDIQTKSSYYTTSDISDRAEFNRMLSELRKIVSRTPLLEKQAVLKQIKQIAEGYR